MALKRQVKNLNPSKVQRSKFIIEISKLNISKNGILKFLKNIYINNETLLYICAKFQIGASFALGVMKQNTVKSTFFVCKI